MSAYRRGIHQAFHYSPKFFKQLARSMQIHGSITRVILGLYFHFNPTQRRVQVPWEIVCRIPVNTLTRSVQESESMTGTRRLSWARIGLFTYEQLCILVYMLAHAYQIQDGQQFMTPQALRSKGGCDRYARLCLYAQAQAYARCILVNIHV